MLSAIFKVKISFLCCTLQAGGEQMNTQNLSDNCPTLIGYLDMTTEQEAQAIYARRRK
jgi:hypothetical protein